jgi:hypothetical protein
MTTIREVIAAKRAKREANSAIREKLRQENAELSKEIGRLEAAIAQPKRPKPLASPDDPITVLKVEAAQVRIAPVKV